MSNRPTGKETIEERTVQALVDKGYTREQALGLIANMKHGTKA